VVSVTGGSSAPGSVGHLSSSQTMSPAVKPDRCRSQMSTRMGLGLKPLQGLLICGQLERAHSTPISASHTAAKRASLHPDRLRRHAVDVDLAARDRLIAGARLPAALVVKAQKFRRCYRHEVLRLFAKNGDAFIAPAKPFTAPRLGQQTVLLDGAELPLRPDIGIVNQPHLIHRPARRRCPRALATPDDWRANYRAAVARRPGFALRL
jgi:hypothetical protein